jgi:uncharacterized membrane protein
VSNGKQQPKGIQVTQSLSFVGPLPPATEFAGYDKALPGTAERILTMAEKEVEHRHKNDDNIIKASIKLNTRGQILAFVISIISLGALCVSIFSSHPVASIAPAIIAISSLVSIFFNRNK